MVGDHAPLILMIEDDRDTSRMLSTFLKMDGFRVEQAYDGKEGLEKAEEVNPDLIVLDIIMPGMGGLEVMNEMRSNPKTSSIPIIFLSGVGDESVIVQCLKGADDYVTKPFRPLELEERIKKVLERKKAEGEMPGTATLSEERLAVEIGNDTFLVPLEDVLYFEAQRKYCFVYTNARRYLIGKSISELESKLSSSPWFLRVHRSYIVNLNHVIKLTRTKEGNAILHVGGEGAHAIAVSKSYYPQVKERLGL